jgi:hypothetical protein
MILCEVCASDRDLQHPTSCEVRVTTAFVTLHPPIAHRPNNAAVRFSPQTHVASTDGFGPKSLASLQKAKGPQERFTVPETHEDMVLDGENPGVDPQLLAVTAS